MLVKMKKSERGSTNGIDVNNYVAGKTYDLPESLYDVFVNKMKIAESASPDKSVQEEKMVTPPSNKAVRSEDDKKDKKGKKDKKDKDDGAEPENPF